MSSPREPGFTTWDDWRREQLQRRSAELQKAADAARGAYVTPNSPARVACLELADAYEEAAHVLARARGEEAGS